MLAIPARVIATSFAIFCFICTIVYGLYNGNSPQSIFWSAVSVALVALVMGSAIGALMLRSINEQIERHRADNPIPEEHDTSDTDSDPASTPATVG